MEINFCVFFILFFFERSFFFKTFSVLEKIKKNNINIKLLKGFFFLCVETTLFFNIFMCVCIFKFNYCVQKKSANNLGLLFFFVGFSRRKSFKRKRFFLFFLTSFFLFIQLLIRRLSFKLCDESVKLLFILFFHIFEPNNNSNSNKKKLLKCLRMALIFFIFILFEKLSTWQV